MLRSVGNKNCNAIISSTLSNLHSKPHTEHYSVYRFHIELQRFSTLKTINNIAGNKNCIKCRFETTVQKGKKSSFPGKLTVAGKGNFIFLGSIRSKNGMKYTLAILTAEKN